MAHAITFDIFRYAKNLQKSGFTEVQVEAQVEFARAQIEFVKEQTDEISNLINDSLATKQDIKELEAKIESSKDKIIIWLGSMTAASVAIIITTLGFLINLYLN